MRWMLHMIASGVVACRSASRSASFIKQFLGCGNDGVQTNCKNAAGHHRNEVYDALLRSCNLLASHRFHNLGIIQGIALWVC